MPSYTAISKSDFDDRYSKLSEVVNREYNLDTPFLDSLLPLFSSNINKLTTQEDLDKKFFVLNKDENYKSFLHKAAAENNLRLIIYLEKTNHDIDLTDGLHRTALYVACDQLKLNAVQALLLRGANPNIGNTQLVAGIRGDRTPLNAVINSELIDSSLVVANANNERIAAIITKKLIDAGADVNLQTGEENFSALHRAILNRKPLILQEIINSDKANYELVSNDRDTILHMLVDYRSKDEKENGQAKMHEEKQMLDLLLPHINSIDEQDKNGNTALHTAVINSNVDVVETLYKKDYFFTGIEKLFRIPNNNGNTVLHLAIQEAHRGPKILALLMRVATEDDLNAKNNAGESPKELAIRLINQRVSLQNLLQNITIGKENLDDAIVEHGSEIDELNALRDVNQLKEALIELNEYKLNGQSIHNKASKQFTVNIEYVIHLIDEVNKNHASLFTDNLNSLSALKNIVATTHQFVMGATTEFKEIFEDTYLNSLNSVQQTEYLAWKNEQLKLPSSFLNQEIIDPNLLNAHSEHYFVAGELAYRDGFNFYNQGNYDEAIRRLRVSTVAFRTHYPQHRALANSYLQLGKAYQAKNDLINARENFKKSINIYTHLKEYSELETTYQNLAETYINDRKAALDYETDNQNKLLANSETEKLQAHLALAGLYKQIKEHPDAFSLLEDDLSAYESFHYKESYKLTQGNLDNDAHVVLQSEFGIAQHEKLGTYNIKQCVAVIVYDPFTQKVVLSHFDKFSGPLSFIDQIRQEFPGESKLDFYLTGGRDREVGKQISDSNIDQVLKQIYAYKERFDIKATDIGDKFSPEAIVFDVESRELRQGMPNHPDSSLNSRVANFLIQERKDDYLRPPNVVDFTKSEIERTKTFTQEQEEKINGEYTDFEQEIDQTQGWNHDSKFFLLMESKKEVAGFNPDFNTGLLRKHHYSGAPVYYQPGLPPLARPNEENGLNALDNLHIDEQLNNPILLDPIINQANHEVIPIDDLDSINVNDLVGAGFCMGRSRREIDTRFKREAICVFDSEKIIEKIKVYPESKRSDILQKLEAEKPEIGGSKQAELTTLINNHRVTQHLNTVGKFSSHLIDGMFSEEAVAGLFKGDPTAAVKLAGLNLVNRALLKGSELLEQKRLLALATGMKGLGFGLGARVITKGTSLLAGYDLYNQIKALQNNTNSTDAIVGIVSDGIQIGTDLLRGGIEVAEISSERFAAMGISVIAGPAGEIVVTAVMLGDRIYDDVEIVDKEDHHVHLSGWEKFKEGGRAFLFFSPAVYISRMIEKAAEYERKLAIQSKLFEQIPEIKHIIIPAIERKGEKCRVVIGEQTCTGGGLLFPPTCTNEKTVCDPIYTDVLYNAVYFQNKLIGFELTRLRITVPAGSELLCVPTENDGSGEVLSEQGAYACDDAIGLTNTNNTVGEIAYFNLGLGEDHAVGFERTPNVFMVNNGAKDFKGGEGDDSFIVQATQIWTARPKDREGIGGLNGAEGSDSLILSGFQPTTDRIEINLNEGYLQAGNNTLALNSIEKLVGGAFPVSITAACGTEMIDMAGGLTVNNPNTLLIPCNANCDYDLKMHLHPNTNVTNAAAIGNFTYYILPGNGLVSVDLTATENYPNTQHQFVFNTPISEVSSKVFASKSTNEQLQTMKLNFIAGLEFQLNTNLSNNTRLHFVDSETSAEFKMGKQNGYVFLTTKLNIEDIMRIYPAVASRLNIIFIINTSENETVIIGHQGQEVMRNNLRAQRTHLHGNGGEGLFVMDANSSRDFRSQLPLNEVIIYHAKNDTHIDSLDFRKLHNQIQILNATAEIFFRTSNRINKLGNDVLLQLVMKPKNSERRINIINICLKDALINQWYKQYLHVVLNIAPNMIVGPRSNLYLKPIDFHIKAESMSIGVKDIEENTIIIIPEGNDSDNFAFYHHNRTNLIFTNSLNNLSVGFTPITILFKNFYQEPKLATLVIKFANTHTKIRLRNKVTNNQIADFDMAWKTHTQALQKDSLAIINSDRSFSSVIKNVSSSRLWHDRYFSNDINASLIEIPTDVNSIEDNELSVSRRRRDVERLLDSVSSNAAAHHNGIIQKTFKAVNSVMNSLFSSNFEDKILDMADHYEKSQYPIKALSKGAKHSRRKAVKSPVKQVNDSTKQKILESPRQVQNLVLPNKTFKKTDRIQAHKKSAVAETCKRTSLFKPVQTKESYNPQNTRENKQNSYANHNQIKLGQITSGNLHKIGHQAKHLHSKSLVKVSLAGENHQHSYQQARQQAGKSGISQVTASSNVNATLLLFNVMSRYKCQQPLNAKVARWSEQVDRQKQKISGKPMGLRL
ncbi:ankyrin repeat domain-containing protein [Rickettsiella endosymbiont of Aleochara curtula]|uniref:ankyrin repeat domain-containing protein n=1 Tax=Rickettsiella endosymbiont of Aleochara curtula TaxID=3077936 RepID=UPI00313EA9EB